MNAEIEQLIATLNAQRSGFLKKLAGLSEADARRSTVGSGTNLAGLLQHLTFVESKWFSEVVGGGKAHGTRTMTVPSTVKLSELRASYREACEISDGIVATFKTADAPNKKPQGKARNLRSAMLAVIEETARHAGHADIIREQIDGHVGR
jgi:hypothetical protein